MSRQPSPTATASPAKGGMRAWNTLAAFAIGIPLAIIVLFSVETGIVGPPGFDRYVSHNVEKVEVLLFCCALGALAVKWWNARKERAACLMQVLPAWNGTAVPASEAEKLLGAVQSSNWRFRNTYLVRRVSGVLSFVKSRGSAAELDDHIRTLADNDAIALENSYALVRFITWAIPILGFLGTVLGITGAISGVTPEDLEHNLSKVTDGLALAFDATALGLALTMITMFCTYLVDRSEQDILVDVDQFADEHLAHRFERTGAEGGEFVEVVRQNTQVLVKATEQLVQKQVDIWSKAMADAERRWIEVEERQLQGLSKTLETALEHTLETHAKRLAELEAKMLDQTSQMLIGLNQFALAVTDAGQRNLANLAELAKNIHSQTETLAGLQSGEKHLLHLQEVLSQNLNVLAGSGAFDQAVHNLTAAIHLLTARSVPLPSGGASRIGIRQSGNAA